MGAHKKRAWVLTGIFALLAMVFFAVNGSEESILDGDRAAADSDEIREDLTVSLGDLLPEEARCDSDEFLWHSLQEVREGDPAYRQWSDAVSTPFESSDPDEMRDELFGEHCGNPTELTMSIEALSDMAIDGHNIGELNPWMGEYIDAVNDPGMREAYLKLKDGEGDIVFVTEEYQQYAAMTNTLLMAFEVRGVEALQSVKNWHLPVPTVGELPRAVLNDQQEGLPALVFEYTVKDGCPLVAFGYNVGDKRFEVFPGPVCEEPPPTTSTTKPPTTTVPTTSTTKPPTTSTTTPSTTTTVPSTTTSTIPETFKDHTESPVSDDRNDPDEVTRPNIPVPPEVIRPPGSQPTQPPPPSTIPDPPEVLDPKPATPGPAPTTPAPPDPVGNGDTTGDGIPD